MSKALNKPLAIQDIRELQAFSAILHFGSLTASANHLSLPKSTVSRRISQLESRLGQRLLRREASRILPTEAGLEFANFCEQILQSVYASQQALDSLKEEIKGEMHFAFHHAFTRGWLANVIEDFMQQYPQLTFKMRTAFTPPKTSAGEEICLWVGDTGNSDMRQELLGHLTQGIYASPNYLQQQGEPNHPRELVHYQWIDTLTLSPTGIELFHPIEGRYLLPASPSLVQVDQLVLQGDAICRNKGLGFFPDWLAALRLEAHPGTMQRCLPQWHGPRLPVSLLYPYGHLSKRSRALLDHLRAATPDAIKHA